MFRPGTDCFDDAIIPISKKVRAGAVAGFGPSNGCRLGRTGDPTVAANKVVEIGSLLPRTVCESDHT
jgi:hypothetical protein